MGNSAVAAVFIVASMNFLHVSDVLKGLTSASQHSWESCLIFSDVSRENNVEPWLHFVNWLLRTAGRDTWDILRSDVGDLSYCYLPGGVFTSSYRKLSACLILYSVQDWLEETMVTPCIPCSHDHFQQLHPPFQCLSVYTRDPWVAM